MSVDFMRSKVLPIILFLSMGVLPALAETEDLGGGFLHHGVATPVSNHRGIVATVDGEGRNVVLVWLFDHRGGYALLLIDAETGKSEEFPVPFPPGNDCPYASILSSKNRFYTHFNSWFVEFDPVKREFTFFQKTAPQMAMSMMEDDRGVIWSVTYPSSGLVSFDPETREFVDYGHVHDENWAQYQRFIAADDAGWIYFGVGNTTSQIVAFNPATREAKAILPDERKVPTASASVYRNRNGKVYGHTGSGKGEDWFEFHGGEVRELPEPPTLDAISQITGSQGLFHKEFPDGKRVKVCDLVDRLLIVEDPAAGASVEHRFEYSSEGAHIMGIAAAPDGSICGGTTFPMRFFRYDPKTDEWVNRPSYGQWNTVARQGDRFYAGGYGGGFLLEWDPAADWVETVQGKEGCNPLFLVEGNPSIHRPHDLLAHPDGKTLILAGTPGYGYTGGGLLFWDREKKKSVLIEHTDLLPEHSTHSLVALPHGTLLGGTTTSPGTGGEKKAKEAEMYILDAATRQIEWREAVLPGVQSYTDLVLGEDSKVYGIADLRWFFVFDPTSREIVHRFDLAESPLGRTVSQQGPRVFVETPGGEVYLLLVKGIARLDKETFEIEMIAESPVPLGNGGDFLDGRIYFTGGSHLYSWAVPAN